jgi:hypothetical protein
VKKTLWCLAVLVCVTALTAWAVEPAKPAAKPAAGPALSAQEKADLTKRVDLFAGVAAAGESQKDPLLILTAVKLLDQLPVGGIQKPDATDKSTYTRDALLAEAKEYAAGDAELLAVVAKLQDAPEATAVRGWRHYGDGPGYYYDRRYHHHRNHCLMVRECGYHGCEWVCRGREGYRDWD